MRKSAKRFSLVGVSIEHLAVLKREHFAVGVAKIFNGDHFFMATSP